VDSFGVWDLIHRYLLPDWWIIPVYTTITAWIATAAWWRRALRAGRAWAHRLLLVVEDGPLLRRYLVRLALAFPFLVVSLAAVAGWYVVGCGIWAAFHEGRFGLAPTWVSLLAAGYGLVGIVLVAIAYGDAEYFLGAALWYGAAFGIPYGILGLINLAFVLLELAQDLVFSRPAWSTLWTALWILVPAVIPAVSFALFGWLARIGWNLLTGNETD
jgi:hypothetical protein